MVSLIYEVIREERDLLLLHLFYDRKHSVGDTDWERERESEFSQAINNVFVQINMQ